MRRVASAILICASVACTRPESSVRLDALADSIAARVSLSCGAPHVINTADAREARMSRICSNARPDGHWDSDTLFLISRDSVGHALGVTRVWPLVDPKSGFERTRAALAARHGAPRQCEQEPVLLLWRDRELDLTLRADSGGVGLGIRLAQPSDSLCVPTA